jgi:HEAT repeat protein
VRGHAARALGRLGSPAATALRERVEVEADPGVRQEIAAALDALTAPAR